MRKKLIHTLTAAAIILAPQLIDAQTVSTLRLSEPVVIDGIHFAPDGDLVAASGWSGRVLYRITDGGEVDVRAEGLAGPIHAVSDSEGRIYAANYSDEGTVGVIAPGAGHAERLATLERGAAGIALGPDGDLYVSIYGDPNGSGDTIYRVTPEGRSEVFVSGAPLAAPVGLAFDDQGRLYAVNSRDGRIHRVEADGAVSLLATLPSGEGFFASGHLVYGKGVLYASGNHHNRVYEVSLDGEVRTLAGTGEPGDEDGPADSARLTIPNGMALSPDGGRLYVVPGGPGAKEVLRVIHLR